MKVKEYVKQLNEAPDRTHALRTILAAFIKEMNDLIEVRHAKSLPTIRSILLETDQKWRKFAELTGCAEGAFRIIVSAESPSIAGMFD